MPLDVVLVRGLGRESVSGLRRGLRRDSDSTAAIKSLPTSPVSCSNKYPFDRCASLVSLIRSAASNWWSADAKELAEIVMVQAF